MRAPSLRTNFTGVLAGAAVAFFVAYGVSVALPMADRSLWEVSASTPPRTEQIASGRSIYVSEGCWYCHTQSVRPVAVDLGLGAVTFPDRVSRDAPPELGMVRVGQDLSCVGARFESAEALASYLVNPRETRPNSTMPSLSGLSDEELTDLAAYLSSLSC